MSPTKATQITHLKPQNRNKNLLSIFIGLVLFQKYNNQPIVFANKGLKLPKEQSEVEIRRTDNEMVKSKQTNNSQQDIT